MLVQHHGEYVTEYCLQTHSSIMFCATLSLSAPSLSANAGPRVPSSGVTLKRRCTYQPSVIYLIVNKLLSLSLSLSLQETGSDDLVTCQCVVDATRSRSPA